MLSRLIFTTGLPTWALFAEMAIAGLVVIFAGVRLARLADTLSDRLNLSGGWTGLLLLATVTSLPEVITGGTATWLGNADLAFAGIFGSCSFNITIIFVLNAIIGGGSVLGGTSRAHTLTSSFGLLLIGMALAFIVLVEKFAGSPRVAQAIELACVLLIIVTYLSCMRLTYQYERGLGDDQPAATNWRAVPNPMYVRLVVLAVIMVAASWWLAKIGDVLSTHEIEMIGRSLGATFVGATFLAIATSLPEIATSITAVRLGNLDLALGNLFGSNMFNIAVIPMMKAVSLARGDDLLMSGANFDTGQNLFAGILPIILTAIAIAGLTYHSRRSVLKRFGFDSVLIAVVYLIGMWALVTTPG